MAQIKGALIAVRERSLSVPRVTARDRVASIPAAEMGSYDVRICTPCAVLQVPTMSHRMRLPRFAAVCAQAMAALSHAAVPVAC